MESHFGGPIILSQYIELIKEYKNDVQSHQNDFENEIIASQEPNPLETKYLRKAASKLYAYVYLDNSDKSKYKSILKNLNLQNSFGNNQYPKNITEANNILNNHKFDGCYTISKQTQKSQNFKKEQDVEENEDNLSLTFTQIEGKCYCCGKSGHKLPQCRFKNKPKTEWFINNVQLTQKNKEITIKSINDTEEIEETSLYSGNLTITSKSNPKRIGWINLHYSLSNYNQNQSEIMKTQFCQTVTPQIQYSAMKHMYQTSEKLKNHQKFIQMEAQ